MDIAADKQACLRCQRQPLDAPARDGNRTRNLPRSGHWRSGGELRAGLPTSRHQGNRGRLQRGGKR
eukprot:2701214-Lingulodinium_polyedra.AAC.1